MKTMRRQPVEECPDAVPQRLLATAGGYHLVTQGKDGEDRRDAGPTAWIHPSGLGNSVARRGFAALI